MNFGIGTNTQGTNVGSLQGTQMDIACACWFTQMGDTKPFKFKFQDKDGTIQTVDKIHVNYTEKKNYAGVHSYEYDCTILFDDKYHHVKLLYFLDEGKWVMNFK